MEETAQQSMLKTATKSWRPYPPRLKVIFDKHRDICIEEMNKTPNLTTGINTFCFKVHI